MWKSSKNYNLHKCFVWIKSIIQTYVDNRKLFSLACTHHTVVQLVYLTIYWSKQPRSLYHFTNGHIFCYSFFLTASVPQIYSSLFPWLNNLKKGTYRQKTSMPGTPYAVLKYWLEKLLKSSLDENCIWSSCLLSIRGVMAPAMLVNCSGLVKTEYGLEVSSRLVMV